LPFSFDPLWHLLIDKGITKEKLRTKIGSSPATIAKMGKNQYVSMAVLDSICNYLDCRIEEVVKHIPDKEKPR